MSSVARVISDLFFCFVFLYEKYDCGFWPQTADMLGKSGFKCENPVTVFGTITG